jgi:hypothetical protein
MFSRIQVEFGGGFIMAPLFKKPQLKLIKNKEEFRSGFLVEFALRSFGGNQYEYC